MRFFSSLITALISVSVVSATYANSFKTEEWITANGVKVIFYQAMEVPMLDISLAFRAGSAYDSSNYGISALTTHMMNQGNSGLDATAIAEHLADNGSQFSAESGKDMIILNLRTLTHIPQLNESINTFSQIINHPDFPDDAFNRQKEQQLMSIEQIQESPDEVASMHFFQALYHAHPYGHPITGTADTVKAINKQQLNEFYKRYFVGSNAILVLVGAVDSKTAHHLTEQLISELPKGEPSPPITPAAQLSHAERIQIPFPSSQTLVRLGQVGIEHHNPNYFPLVVGNYILGGGALVSRLAVEVREKRGLTYGVDSQFVPMSGNGPFLISLATKKEQAGNALQITEDTLQQFIKNGPDKNELIAAKKYLTGSYPLSLASNRNIASLLLRMAFYHLPNDYLDTYVARINAVSAADIKKAFQEQVKPNTLLLITVGQP